MSDNPAAALGVIVEVLRYGPLFKDEVLIRTSSGAELREPAPDGIECQPGQLVLVLGQRDSVKITPACLAPHGR